MVCGNSDRVQAVGRGLRFSLCNYRRTETGFIPRGIGARPVEKIEGGDNRVWAFRSEWDQTDSSMVTTNRTRILFKEKQSSTHLKMRGLSSSVQTFENRDVKYHDRINPSSSKKAKEIPSSPCTPSCSNFRTSQWIV